MVLMLTTLSLSCLNSNQEFSKQIKNKHVNVIQRSKSIENGLKIMNIKTTDYNQIAGKNKIHFI